MADLSSVYKLSVAVGVSVVVLAVRVAFYWSSSNILTSLAPKKIAAKERAVWVKKMQEEIFTTVGGAILTVFGTYIIFVRNGPRCDWWDTSDCYSGFPDNYRPMDSATRAYFTVELAWYLHQIPKHSLGVGVTDSPLMNLHHGVTIILVSLAMTTGLHRSAALILALLNFSNPLLHLSKIANIFDLKVAKVVLFALFAVVFFVTRLVLYPVVILWSTLVDSAKIQPRLWFGDIAWIYITINSMLLALYVMQVLWMRGILKILLQAVSSKGTAEDLRRVTESTDTVTTRYDRAKVDDIKAE